MRPKPSGTPASSSRRSCSSPYFVSLFISPCGDENPTPILASLQEKRISGMSGNGTTLPFTPNRPKDREGSSPHKGGHKRFGRDRPKAAPRQRLPRQPQHFTRARTRSNATL